MPTPLRRRRGVTILESLLALVLVATGLLALATASATFLAHATFTERRLAGEVSVQGILDSLRVVACPSLVAGSASRADLTASWTLQPVGTHRRIDLVAIVGAGRRQQQTQHVLERSC